MPFTRSRSDQSKLTFDRYTQLVYLSLIKWLSDLGSCHHRNPATAFLEGLSEASYQQVKRSSLSYVT